MAARWVVDGAGGMCVCGWVRMGVCVRMYVHCIFYCNIGLNDVLYCVLCVYIISGRIRFQ